MLHKKGLKTMTLFLHFGCNLMKFYPYAWNRRTFRMEVPSRSHLFIYNVHRWIHWMEALFVWGRLLQSLTWENRALRIVLLNTAWSGAMFLSSLCYLQFETRREGMMSFTNSLFDFIRKPSSNSHTPKLPTLSWLFLTSLSP